MGDKELDIIIDFSRGDEKAFRVLYDKYVVALRYFAAKYLNEDTMIDDVVLLSIYGRKGLISGENMP